MPQSIDFCLKVLFNAEQLIALGNKEFPGKRFPGPKKNIIESLKNEGITVEQIRNFCRDNNPPTNTDLIKTVLRSGKLNGHSWEKAMPSNLHLSIQNLVRACFAGEMNIDNYLEKGNNIIKHEFFITAIHDLMVQAIVDNFDDIIPSITSRGTIDFVSDANPYDLKITPPIKGWTYGRAKATPIDFAKSLYEGADTERIRKSAEDAEEFNRLYVVYDDAVIWTNPEVAETKVIEAFSRRPAPFTLDIDGKQIKVLVLFLN